MNNELETKAIAIAQSYIDKANAIFNCGFVMPRITWDIRSKGIAGMAYRNEWRIALNAGYVHENHLWDATIGHEIAHLITRKLYPYSKQAHGPEWKTMMIRLGLAPKRCHEMGRLGQTYSYKCPTCQTVFSLSPIVHKRMSQGQNRFCIKPACKNVHRPIERCNAEGGTSA